MKKTMLLLFFALFMLVLAGCGSQGKESQGNVATNGSTSMEQVIGVLSEAFMHKNSQIKISYDASGSGTGIEAVRKGSCDIGLASRHLTESEKNSGLVATPIALDGIAIIVNEQCTVDNLTMEAIAGLYTGRADGSQLGFAGPVAAIGREAGSGTRDGFETITKTKDQCRLSQELTSTGAVIEAVRRSPAAIGYVSYAAAINQKGIKILKVNGVECTEQHILSGEYGIQRPFNLITKKDTPLSSNAQAFFDYMISAEAAPLIGHAGAVPVKK